MNTKTSLLLFAFFLSNANFSYSQGIASNTEGFGVKVFASFDSWNSNSFWLSDLADENPNGNGLGIQLSYGFNPSIEAYASYAFSSFNKNGDYNHVKTDFIEFGAQFNFGASLQRLRPFVNAGLVSMSFKTEPVDYFEAGYLVIDDGDAVDSGLGFAIGGGVDYYFIPELSAGFNVSGRFGNYSSSKINGLEIELDESVDFTYFRIALGVSYHFY